MFFCRLKCQFHSPIFPCYFFKTTTFSVYGLLCWSISWSVNPLLLFCYSHFRPPDDDLCWPLIPTFHLVLLSLSSKRAVFVSCSAPRSVQTAVRTVQTFLYWLAWWIYGLYGLETNRVWNFKNQIEIKLFSELSLFLRKTYRIISVAARIRLAIKNNKMSYLFCLIRSLWFFIPSDWRFFLWERIDFFLHESL